MLRQIAYLSSSSVDLQARPPHAQKLKPGKSFGEYTSRISIIRFPDEPRPDWLPEDPKPGFSTLETSGGKVRVFAYPVGGGRTILVAQPTRARDELTMNSALFALVPLLLLLPGLVWLTLKIVRAQLSPISRLAAHLDAQPAEHPQPLPDRGFPSEITPFVEAINRLLQRINKLMSEQRRFVADAAHELRTPLTALALQVVNLKQAESLDSMRERAAPLEAGIERARKLTEQLLNMARIQSETIELVSVDVSALVRELIAEFLPLAEEKRIDLGLDEERPLSMLAAPETLRRLLRSILENAVKYTPSDGEVTIRLAADDWAATIEIIDNGPGIPTTERERVFDAFYRAPGQTVEGSGLGLAIAREASSKLGGTLTLSDPLSGQGLVVRYQHHRTTAAI